MSNVLDSQVTSTKIYSKITTANKYEWSETLMKEIISRDGHVDPDGAGPLINIKKCLEALNNKIKLEGSNTFKVKYRDENDVLINPQPTDP